MSRVITRAYSAMIRFVEPLQPRRAGPACGALGGAGQDTAADLDLAHVTVRYGGHVAVNDVSLTAPADRITGLIAPHGARKTTLFNVASGRLRPRVPAVQPSIHVTAFVTFGPRMFPDDRGGRWCGCSRADSPRCLPPRHRRSATLPR